MSVNKYIYKYVIQHKDNSIDNPYWEDVCEYDQDEHKEAIEELKEYRSSISYYTASSYRMIQRRVLNTENIEKTQG